MNKKNLRLKARGRSDAFRANHKSIAISKYHATALDRLREKFPDAIGLTFSGRPAVMEHLIMEAVRKFGIDLPVADNATQKASIPDAKDVTGIVGPGPAETASAVTSNANLQADPAENDLGESFPPDGKLWKDPNGNSICVQFSGPDERRFMLKFNLGFAYNLGGKYWMRSYATAEAQAQHYALITQYLRASTKVERDTVAGEIMTALKSQPMQAGVRHE